MANLKGIFKAAIAGATMIGGAVLGLEAKKCFTKPVAPEDEFDDDVFCEETTEVEDPAEEEDEVPED